MIPDRAINLFLVALLQVVACAVANAGSIYGFVTNYTQWRQMDTAAQLGYAMAASDKLMEEYTDPVVVSLRISSKASWPIGRGLIQCHKSLGLTAGSARDLVNNHYAAHPESWDRAPYTVLETAMYKACEKYIDAELNKLDRSRTTRISS